MMFLMDQTSKLVSNSILVTSSLIVTSLFVMSGQLQANYTPTLDVQDQTVDLGGEVSFLVAPADTDGVVPAVFMHSGPEGAKLADNGDGTRTFSWRPKKAGTFSVNFTVQDGLDANLSNQYQSVISVADTNGVRVATSAAASVQPQSSPSIAVSPTTPTTQSALKENIYLGDQVGAVSKILTDLPVSTSQTNVQQSPVDSSGRYLYTANIERASSRDGKGAPLRTVLRQGYQRADNTWEWKNVTVDERTLYNRWHTAPSVAVDKAGKIHIAYNMHNFPWQYKKSDQAHNINSLVFRGQPITDAELKLAEEKNQTRFPTLGSADIPGNQITYPSFYKDRNGKLFVSYRFAAAPKRGFSERTMSTGIASYDTNSNKWTSVGARFNHTNGDFDADSTSPGAAVVFAGKRGWTSYLARVAFSKQNELVASMFWRSGIAGRQVSMPCVIRSMGSNDVVDMKGSSMSFPIQPDKCGNIGVNNNMAFYSIGSFTIDNQDNPYLLMSPTEGSRFISRYDSSQQRWIQEKAPQGATEIFFDKDNNLYAIASGIKIYKRASVNSKWETIYSDSSANNCYPKVNLDARGESAFIHAQSCDEKHITIYGLKLP